jgi:hypothetical protein
MDGGILINISAEGRAVSSSLQRIRNDNDFLIQLRDV